MSGPRDPDRLIAAFLDEGPTMLPERTVDAVLGEIHRSRHRAVLGPWRTAPMSRSLLVATALVAALAVGGLAVWVSQPATRPVAAPSSLRTAPASLPPASAPATAATSPAAYAGPGGTIVFGRADGSNQPTHLYAIDPNGSGRRPLLPGAACCLVGGPNALVLYATQASPSAKVVSGAQGVDGTFPERFTEPEIGSLSLAPGAFSSRFDVAFEGWDPKDPSRTGVYVSLDNGGGLLWGVFRRLTTGHGDLHDIPLAYSPDGSRLLFERQTSTTSQTGDLYVIGRDGQGLRKLNTPTSGVQFDDVFGSGASWSPDGTKVTWAGFDARVSGCEGTGIYVADVATGRTTKVLDSPSCTTSARWSPDGRWIAFDRNNGGSLHSLFLVHPDGTRETNISGSTEAGVCCAQWSPDGSALVAQGGAVETASVDLWVLAADGSWSERLTSQPGIYEWYSWLP
jgi:hypothetical protein